jgi:hypothetical protein
MQDVFTNWPRVADFARDIGVRRGTAQGWKDRGMIPGRYDAHIIDAARRRGIKGVTAEYLARERAQAYEARDAVRS